MEYILEGVRINWEKGDILLGCCCCNMFLLSFLWRGSVSDLSEGNVKILGGDRDEEKTDPILL